MHNRKIKTIIVDDENRIRRGIERLIVACGEEFEIVGSYSSATKLMEDYQKDSMSFDLLVTDIKMPGMDGLELIKELKNRASFEAVMISGFNDFQYLQTAIREGALDYLMKPLIREEFRKRLGAIKDKIKRKWESEEKVEVMDFELTYVKQVQRLSELTRGHDIDLAELEWTKDFPQGAYFLLCISIDSKILRGQSVSVNPQVETRIQEVLKSFYEESNTKFWQWRGGKSSFWVLIHNENLESLHETKLAKLLIELNSTDQLSTTIVLSRTFDNVVLIPAMMDETFSLLQFRLIYGENKIYTFSSVQNKLLERGDLRNSKDLAITITRILDSLERNKQEDVFKHLNCFFSELKQVLSPLEIEQIIQMLSIQTIKRLIKNPFAKDEIVLIQEALQLTKKSPNFITLKNNMTIWMQRVITVQEEINQHETVEPIDTAKKWILNNLGENITIDKIAKQVHMNATYFCEYFKNQTGETILEYVTKARIEKARELLFSTDLKIYDISQKVGYSDTKYFSKLFKKYYGDVPSRFKEKMKI